MEIKLSPIAFVKNSRATIIDDEWESITSEIHLADEVSSEAFDCISDFSHLEIIYYFDKVEDEKIIFTGHPRENPAFPKVGIFAQRKKDRPNRLGLAQVELLEHCGRTIKVKYLDAINGTPILDIKPVFKEYQSKKAITQPAWVSEMMKNYWKK